MPTNNDNYHGGCSPVHSNESLKRIYNRLFRIEGYIREVKTMVAENHTCPEILVQLAVVRDTINQVSRLILDEHFNECIARVAHNSNLDKEIRELKSALDKFLP
ncbi:metal-sensing transcriptional repressor [Cyanobacterium sp. uoEpiScrs1]|uniref:metal-sensing transcriptional repressor n=1 Tax=Cyanobacterium sp. uoEpiScrs1 TaxID=2976343 RepID=UPI00226A307B|nr:metal-sensing transcriptional repressor [Cyanobacterium sp. uoEpiScrs1]